MITNNKLIWPIIIFGFLIIATAVLAESGATEKKFLVLSDSDIVKGLLGVRHEFPNGFSANDSLKLKTLKALGAIATEEIQLYQISPARCGDGTCQGNENAVSCPQDCHVQTCGDGICEGTETYANCPNDCECFPSNQYPWGITKIGGGSGGQGMTIAVLDTGVDTNHPDLAGKIIDCQAFGYAACEDDNGHGTHVAGSALANGKIKGVAPEANLMALKVCDNAGYCWGDDVAAGIYYAVDHNANIISMSFYTDSLDYLAVEAIDYAVNNNVLAIAGAGNNGPNPDTIVFPASYYKVIAVASINSDETVSSFSGRGITDGDDLTITEKEIELAAPGGSIESTTFNGCYGYKSGTSMATPHISGLAAKLWQGTAEATRLYLRFITKDIDVLGYDIASGYGLPIVPVCQQSSDCAAAPSCSSVTCLNPGTPNAVCDYQEFGCINNDGCCSDSCMPSNDNDCLAFCGDGICAGSVLGESCSSCAADCACIGTGCTQGCCGDGKCSKKETTASCSVDCH